MIYALLRFAGRDRVKENTKSGGNPKIVIGRSEASDSREEAKNFKVLEDSSISDLGNK